MTPSDKEKLTTEQEFERKVSVAADKSVTEIFGWPWEPKAQRAYAACVSLVLQFEIDLNAAYQRQRDKALRAIEERDQLQSQFAKSLRIKTSLIEWIEAKRLSLKADRHIRDSDYLQSLWISGAESLLDELTELLKEE